MQNNLVVTVSLLGIQVSHQLLFLGTHATEGRQLLTSGRQLAP